MTDTKLTPHEHRTVWPDNRYKIVLPSWVEEHKPETVLEKRKECEGEEGYIGSKGLCDYYYDAYVAEEPDCETCEGTGEVDVLYSDVFTLMGSNEAMRRAGEVHHTEVCPDCEEL